MVWCIVLHGHLLLGIVLSFFLTSRNCALPRAKDWKSTFPRSFNSWKSTFPRSFKT